MTAFFKKGLTHAIAAKRRMSITVCNEIPIWRHEIDRNLSHHRASDDATIRDTCHFVQLAVSKKRDDGRWHPSNRTIVCRGFIPGTDFLSFSTDARTDKVKTQSSLFSRWRRDSSSLGEICWYFIDTREQFRLHGKLFLVGDSSHQYTLPYPPRTLRRSPNPSLRDAYSTDAIDWQEERNRMWIENTSCEMRTTFSWPVPGCERNGNDRFMTESISHEDAAAISGNTAREAYKNFGLLLFFVERVDHVILKGFPFSRFYYLPEDSQNVNTSKNSKKLAIQSKWKSYSINP